MVRSNTTAALAAKFSPGNDMEEEVAELLRAAGAHTGEAVEEAEEALALQVGWCAAMSNTMSMLEFQHWKLAIRVVKESCVSLFFTSVHRLGDGEEAADQALLHGQYLLSVTSVA